MRFGLHGVAMALTDTPKIAVSGYAVGLQPRLRAWLSGEHAAAQRMAGMAFVIRVSGAVVIFLSQILLARWMGGVEFGIYVYAWTWLQMIAEVVHLGLPLSAQRIIPEYTERGQKDWLRGFLIGSRWTVFATATLAAMLGATAIYTLTPAIEHSTIMPLYLACIALPLYPVSNMLDGLARSYDAVKTALLPPFVLRPLMLIVVMGGVHLAGIHPDATTAMAAFALATWTTTLVQLALFEKVVANNIEAGPRRYDVAGWVKTASPIFAVWAFYMLLTYTDVLVLRQFRPPEEVAHYYAAAKTLALAAFIHFSVAAAVAHRFATHHVAGDRHALAKLAATTVRWTFWPSLLTIIGILALGKPILWLFGPKFDDAYPLMFILALALLARAAVGPAERVLNMLGEQRRCAMIYAGMFVLNLGGSIAVAGPYGGMGVAVVIAAAAAIESALLFAVAKRRLGLHMFVWTPKPAP
jgi:O-antigen/teichoic acid export membrane protein